MLLRCTVNGDVALYISNTMHPFRFHSSLCPRCCYYQSRHHSFDMTGPVFPFICNGQEILNHFIFQAQQHLFFKKWLSSLSVSISCFLPCLILCAMFIRQSFYSLSPVLFCFCAHPCTPFLSLSRLSLPPPLLFFCLCRALDQVYCNQQKGAVDFISLGLGLRSISPFKHVVHAEFSAAVSWGAQDLLLCT